MGKPDKPELDELKRLLRRLERTDDTTQPDAPANKAAVNSSTNAATGKASTPSSAPKAAPEALSSLKVGNTKLKPVANGNTPLPNAKTAQSSPNDASKHSGEQAAGLPTVIDPSASQVTEFEAQADAKSGPVRIIVITAMTAAIVSSLAAVAVSLVVLRPDLLDHFKSKVAL